jgi:predicted phosphodiesterase
LEKIRADPERLAKHQERKREWMKGKQAADKVKNDPRNMTCHPVDSEHAIILSDLQIPWEDQQAVELALKFIEWRKPDTVIFDGDIVDCYAMSQFDRDPTKTDSTLDELYRSEKLMQRIKKIKSVKKRIWLAGNHEDRWRKILWREASSSKLSPMVEALMHGLGIEGVDAVESFRRAFRVKENGFEFHPYGHYVELAEGNLIVTHGFMVSQHAAYTAKRHFDRLGKCCIVGHSHRLGFYPVTQMGDPKGAWENGCLARLDPEYVQFPNWQQGFSEVRIKGNLFHVSQIPILPGYKIEFAGRTLRV